MSDKKISALTSATIPLSGTEVLPIVQSGSTVKVATLDVTGGVYIGKGASNLASNTVVGNAAFTAVTTGSQTVVVGQSAAVSTTSGVQNTVVGQEAFYTNEIGSYNSAFGRDSLVLSTLDKNSGFGWHSGYNLTAGSNNAFWGYDAQPSTAAVNNEYTYGDANVTKHRFVGGDIVIGTAGKGIQFANTTWLETVVASYKKSVSTTVATGAGRSDQYFLVDPSKTFTITATGLGGLVTIINGSAGEACTFFWSWNTATITILGNGGTTFVASATPLLATLGISKSAFSSVLTFKTGPSFSAGNISVCLINDYASTTTDPV